MTGTKTVTKVTTAAWLVVLANGVWYPAAAAPSKAAVAATVKRDSARCRAEADLDACYDALRRSPADAELSIALGDALMRADRPGDAVRSYRRAALLAPHRSGLAAKLKAADAGSRLSPKRFSNAAVYGQSH